MNKYSLKISKIDNGPGKWQSNLCEVLNEKGEKLGSYIRYYDSFSKNTFAPFEYNGKEYALISSDYQTISVITLPDCKIYELKEECKKQLFHFCPVSIYIPKIIFYRYKENIGKDKNDFGYAKTYKEEKTEIKEKWDYKIKSSLLGFVLGCMWGDDSSMKMNLIDLSKIEEGEVWFINNKREKEWLYEQFPGAMSLEDLYISWDGENQDYLFPESYYLPTETFISFPLNKEQQENSNSNQ